jgi:hypothetical protein
MAHLPDPTVPVTSEEPITALPTPASVSPQVAPATRSAAGLRIRARVALVLLKTLQRLDLPEEVLLDENLTETLPRRLGLSPVVYAQVRRFEEEERKGRHLNESEAVDLFHLISRRPDASRVFHDVGMNLTEGLREGWRSILRGSWAVRQAGRRSVALTTALFGRGLLTRIPKTGDLEVRHPFLHKVDEKGSACALITGLLEGVARVSGGRGGLTMDKVACRARGDDRCVWRLAERGLSQPTEPAPSA